MQINPELVWPVRAELGEGPVWCIDDGALRFVDIKKGMLHRFDPVNGSRETVETGGQPSFIVPSADGQFIVGLGQAIHRFDGRALTQVLATIDMPTNNRTNDATVDIDGRLWFGTMDDAENAPTGALHSLSRGTLRQHGWHAVVTNGPAINCAGDALYHVDSPQRIVWRIPLRDGVPAEKGDIFVRLSEADGHPDGVTVDSEDCLWVALWDGWGLRRYDSRGGLLAEVAMPCARVTKVAFGGPDLATAFVTTARTGLDAQALAKQPEAGGLFAFPAPAPGRPVPQVRV